MLYLPTLGHDWTYDDKVAILSNPDVSNPHANVWDLWFHDFWGNAMMGSQRGNATWTHNSYRPIVVMGLRIERQIAGK